MKTISPKNAALAISTFIVLVFIILIVKSISTFHFPQKSSVAPIIDAAYSSSSRVVEKALLIKPWKPDCVFTGTTDSPFKTVGQAQTPSFGAEPIKPAIVRPVLKLKGILFKASPLSIIEDQNGATSILGIGDSLLGQKIVQIGKTSVTLKDKTGTYDLAVKE